MSEKVTLSRHNSRIVAFKVIFILSQNKKTTKTKAFEYIIKEFFPNTKSFCFTKELITTSIKNSKEIKSWILEFSKEDDIEKMEPLSLSILKMAISEYFFMKTEANFPIIVNEAILISNTF